MIIRFFLYLSALFFPWLILFLEDNPGGAAIALVMQATVIGWPFATVWAFRTIHESRKVSKNAKRKAKPKVEEQLEE